MSAITKLMTPGGGGVQLTPASSIASDVTVQIPSTSCTLASTTDTGNFYGFKNRIINGAMMIDQRNGGASVTPSADTYTLDRWQYQASQASKFAIQQNKGSVTLPAGFSNYLGMSVAAAVTVGASDYFLLAQRIEGLNAADLSWGTANASAATLSFKVYSSLTGTFGGAIRNGLTDRSYPFSYTISSANTWTSVSVTIPGDTSGTWTISNTTWATVAFGLGVGSLLSAAAGSWTAGNYVSATGATSVVGTNGATFYITGVQLEKGSVATSFDYRPYGTELALCQRYYAKITSTSGNGACGCGVARSGTASNVFIKMPVTMRVTPTVSYNTAYLNYNSDVYSAVTGNSGTSGGPDSINYFPNASSASMTVGYTVVLAIGSGGYVDFTSEL